MLIASECEKHKCFHETANEKVHETSFVLFCDATQIKLAEGRCCKLMMWQDLIGENKIFANEYFSNIISIDKVTTGKSR